jgi:hypothetical protein
MDEGQISWEQVFERWKGRGPSNKAFVEAIQDGRQFRGLLSAN